MPIACVSLAEKMREHGLLDADVASRLSPRTSAVTISRWRNGVRTPRRKEWREQLFTLFDISPSAWSDADGKRSAWLEKNPPPTKAAAAPKPVAAKKPAAKPARGILR